MSAGPPPVPGRRPDRDRERARAAREQSREARLRAVPQSNGRRPREPRRTRLTARGRIVMALLFLVALVAAWFLISLFQPFHGDPGGRVAVTIPKNTGVGEIADLLERRGIVSSSFFFEARTTLAGKRGDLKPGDYSLRRDMSYGAAIDALAKGPPANVVTVTVPEGRSRSEIDESLAESGLEGDYLAASKRSRALDPARYGGRQANDLEGFLFPATYELKKGASVDEFVAKQLSEFEKRFAEVDLRAARKVNLTPFDVLTIASLVERETTSPEERPLVASVIYNRLREGIPLQIDATTRFAVDNWDRPLTQSELADPSPYNTRVHGGLPPGPIGNPGIESIEAAAKPADTDYLYYVVNPCKPDTHTFTETKAEFDAAVSRYNAAREAAGGKAPKGC